MQHRVVVSVEQVWRRYRYEEVCSCKGGKEGKEDGGKLEFGSEEGNEILACIYVIPAVILKSGKEGNIDPLRFFHNGF